jgi:hypothetical protein
MLELVMYVAGLLALGAVMIVLIVQFYGLYKEIIAIPRADRAALLVMDRITKEIRSGDQLDTLNSQFGTTNGVIEFDLLDSGTTVSKRYYVESGIVKYQEDGGSATNVTPKDLHVSNFNFTHVSTDVSEAVRLTMELQFQTRNGTETRSYTGFSILRESYE